MHESAVGAKDCLRRLACIPSDRARKVCVRGRGEGIVAEVLLFAVPAAEVLRAKHAPYRQDANNLVKRRLRRVLVGTLALNQPAEPRKRGHSLRICPKMLRAHRSSRCRASSLCASVTCPAASQTSCEAVVGDVCMCLSSLHYTGMYIFLTSTRPYRGRPLVSCVLR